MRRPTSPRFPGRSQQRGYALLLMLVLVTMGLLFSVVSQLSVVGARAARTQGTSAALLQAKEALLGFAATYRDDPANSTEVFGYLPCPDNVGNGQAQASCGSAGETVVGLLPYKTLGLEASRDSANVCLWYVVSGTYKNNPKTVPLNWDTQGRIAVIDAGGNSVVAPDDVNGGAAAVIIAAGPPIAVGSTPTMQSRTHNSSVVCGAVPTEVSEYIESTIISTANATTTLTQGTTESTVSTTNNDQILALTPKEIFTRIIARADFKNPASSTPVGQINALSDSVKYVIEKQLQSDLAAGGAPSGISLPLQTGYTQYSGKWVGDMATAVALTSTSDINYLTNWRNQYRYAVCSNLSTPCLDIVGTSCRAALLFGGRSTPGGPRPSTQNTSTTANLDYFFETGKGRELLNSIATTFSGNTAYLSPAASTSEDVAYCLFPGTFLSFAQNIANFSTGKVGTSSLSTVNTGGGGSIALGSAGGGAGSGCTWNPAAIQMGSLLRLYFRLNWTTKGDGFALALADAATNKSATDATRTQILCGAADGSSMGYAGIPPSGTSAGINSPKIGIEFDTKYDASRNDPHADHSAFLYWGNSADNNSSGNDDNTHYLGRGGFAVTDATWASNAVTVTTASAHGLSAGQVIIISGITPSAYNGTYTVLASGLTNTQFRYTLISDPGTLTTVGMVKVIASSAVTAATWASNAVTLTTASAHGFSAGQVVIVSGITPSAYNGTYTVLASGLTSTQFRYTLTSDPGSLTTVGMVGAVASDAAPRNPRVATASSSFNISTAPVTFPFWAPISGGRITMFTTTGSHDLHAGQKVYISGASPSGYNGVFTLQSANNLTGRFRYLLPTNPGPFVSAGTVTLGSEISSLTWSSGTVSAVSPAANRPTTVPASQSQTIFGVTPSTFDAIASATYTNTTQFSYPMASDPSATFSTETPAGMALVKSSDTHLPYSALPTGTSIYVRLDISRSYDATNHVALLNMKTYVGNTFPLADQPCGASDFQDLSQDMANVCPNYAPTLQQDSIAINRIAALSAASWASSTVTATAMAHGLANGAPVIISGVSPSAYNGSHTVTVVDANTFTYTLASNPGSYVSGGDIQPMANIYFGFTNARSGTGAGEDQSVTIDQLLLRGQ